MAKFKDIPDGGEFVYAGRIHRKQAFDMKPAGKLGRVCRGQNGITFNAIDTTAKRSPFRLFIPSQEVRIVDTSGVSPV